MSTIPECEIEPPVGCPDCEGTGEIDDPDKGWMTYRCETCQGEGVLTR